MSFSQQLHQLHQSSHERFQRAVDQEVKAKNSQFQSIVSAFIEQLNQRYHRHCFIFCDAGGLKQIDCYHRVSMERLCWWSCDQGRYDEITHVAISSPFRDLDDTLLNQEISDFMSAMSGFENAVTASHYFFWQGKDAFDYVDDRYSKEKLCS